MLALLWMALSLAPSLFSQGLTESVVLQANSLQMGMVTSTGTLGSDPTGFTTGPFGPYFNTEPTGLGVVYDPGADGWETGTPALCGEYTFTGYLEESWTLAIDSLEEYLNSSALILDAESPGFISDFELYPAGGGWIRWEGTPFTSLGPLSVNQLVYLDPDGQFISFCTTIRNETGLTIPELYFTRNTDPDNDEAISGSYVTENSILSNFPADDIAIVRARGLTEACDFFLVSPDTSARATRGGFMGGDAYKRWNGIAPYDGPNTATADEAISMSWRFGLSASEAITLSYAYVFDSLAIDEVFDFVLDDPAGVLGLEDLAVCDGAPTTITLPSFPGASWSFSPAVGVTAIGGGEYLLDPSITTEYTVVGSGLGGCFPDSIEVDFSVGVGATPVVDAGPDLQVCLGQTATFAATGSASSWLWTGAGTFLTPTDPTTLGIFTTDAVVTVTAENGGCFGSDSLNVVVLDPPEASLTASTTMINLTAGEFATLTGSGGVSCAWTPSTGVISASPCTIDVQPLTTTTYTLEVTDAFGCTDTQEVTIIVDGSLGLDEPWLSHEPSRIEVIDYLGRTLGQYGNPDQMQIALPDGLYLIVEHYAPYSSAVRVRRQVSVNGILRLD